MAIATDDGWILDDDAPAEVTLGRMRNKVLRTIRKSQYIIRAASRLAGATGTRSRRQQALVIAAAVSRRFQFVSDPVGVQLVRDPEVMLWEYAQGQPLIGNCVEAALLIATLCAAVGIPVRFTALAYDDVSQPYSHVIAEVQLESGRWLPLDITRPYGAAPRPIARALLQEV